MEVIITESQYERMKEAIIQESIELNSSVREYPGSNEVRTSQVTSDSEGNLSIDCGPTTDDIAKKHVVQQWDFNRNRRTAN